MDPNANLEEQRRIIARMQSGDPMGDAAWVAAAQRMIDLAGAMDEWLSRGGFLPQAWERKP